MKSVFDYQAHTEAMRRLMASGRDIFERFTPETERRAAQFIRDRVAALPENWCVIEDRGIGIVAISRAGLRVIMDCSPKLDGKLWVHVSVSRERRWPNYEDMCMARDVFIGADLTAYQVFAPKDQHVNIFSGVFHLWHCLDGDVTPDFTEGMKTI